MQLLIDTRSDSLAEMQCVVDMLTKAIAVLNVPIANDEIEVVEPLPPVGTFGTPSLPPAAPPLPLVPAAPAPAPTVQLTIAPVAPSVPTAPIATAPVVTPAVTGPELDSARLPWDTRINAESRAKVADGTWRKKRNLDPAFYNSVVAELRAQYPLPLSMQHLPPVPTAPSANVYAPPASLAPPATIYVPPAPVAASVVPPAPVSLPPTLPTAQPVGVPPQPPQVPITFRDVAVKASMLVSTGKLQNAQIPMIVAQCTQGQLTTMQQLASPQGSIYLQVFSDALDNAANNFTLPI